jgi:hypothetical protein
MTANSESLSMQGSDGVEIVVEKYVVRLSAEERAQLHELIRKGKRSAQLLTKAVILLKADVSELGEGWSDSRIAAALDDRFHETNYMGGQRPPARLTAFMRAVRAFAHAIWTRGVVGPHQPCQAILPTLHMIGFMESVV